MKADRFTKSVLVAIALLLGVIAIRPSARAQQQGGRKGDLSQLQVSRLTDGRLFIFDAGTGDLMELGGAADGQAGAAGNAALARVGTIRQNADGGWEVTNLKGVAGRVAKRQVISARVDISMLETAVDSFEIDAGRHPSTDEALASLVERPDGVKDWQGPYVKRGVPKDPWGNEYVYRSRGTDNRTLRSHVLRP